LEIGERDGCKAEIEVKLGRGVGQLNKVRKNNLLKTTV